MPSSSSSSSLSRLLLVPVLLIGGASVTATTGTVPGNNAAPAIVKTYENDTVLLPCHVEDLGLETRVRWWRAGVLLADSADPSLLGSNQRIRMWGNRSLELVQVRPEDSGEYVCQASRPEPWGHVTQVHEIQVMYPASAKPSPESGQLEVAFGEEAVMSCSAEGVPKPTLTWSFEGEELPVLAAGEKLRIHATNRSLAGVYTCQASNGIGEPAQATIELKIKHKPEVSALSRWVHSAPGIRAQLDCLVVSWPPSRLEWYFEGEKLARTSRMLRTKQDASGPGQLHSLVIRSVQERDLGEYSCRAGNELGQAEALVELSGMPRPPLLKKEAQPSSSHSYNFIWEVDSYSPIVQYRFWFRQLNSDEDWRKLVIPNSESEADGPLHARSFNLTGLHTSRQYEALVLARNRFGWSSPSKIVRFATLQAADKDTYKTDSASHEEIAPAVQVTSDSDRSSIDVNSSCRLHGNFPALPILLLVLSITVRPEFINGLS